MKVLIFEEEDFRNLPLSFRYAVWPYYHSCLCQILVLLKFSLSLCLQIFRSGLGNSFDVSCLPICCFKTVTVTHCSGNRTQPALSYLQHHPTFTVSIVWLLWDYFQVSQSPAKSPSFPYLDPSFSCLQNFLHLTPSLVVISSIFKGILSSLVFLTWLSDDSLQEYRLDIHILTFDHSIYTVFDWINKICATWGHKYF